MLSIKMEHSQIIRYGYGLFLSFLCGCAVHVQTLFHFKPIPTYFSKFSSSSVSIFPTPLPYTALIYSSFCFSALFFLPSTHHLCALRSHRSQLQQELRNSLKNAVSIPTDNKFIQILCHRDWIFGFPNCNSNTSVYRNKQTNADKDRANIPKLCTDERRLSSLTQLLIAFQSKAVSFLPASQTILHGILPFHFLTSVLDKQSPFPIEYLRCISSARIWTNKIGIFWIISILF